MPRLRRALLGLSLGLWTGLYFNACKASADAAEARTPAASGAASGRPARDSPANPASDASGVLTKEEVSAILGQPVTAVEGKNKHLKYKTDSIYVETTIEVDQHNAIGAMAGARKATTNLGGAPEAVPGLGDEAFFAAMSTLYVRKGDSIALIQAPNYAQQAQAQAMEKFQNASPADKPKAMEELQALMKGAPAMAGLQGADDTKGAMATVNAASRKQGTPAEAKTRAMALALATKLMEKL